jgi:hypothetical protein
MQPFSSILGRARGLFARTATAGRTPSGHGGSSGWPAPPEDSRARRRNADVAAWSPEGPSGEWRRRSLDRFTYHRRG